jgi:hypothetical protein
MGTRGGHERLAEVTREVNDTRQRLRPTSNRS